MATEAEAKQALLCARCGQPDRAGKLHHPVNWVRCQFCYNHEFELWAVSLRSGTRRPAK